MPANDRHLTLQELDGQNWGEPTFDSHVVTECHRLRRVQLGDLTVEDLRLLIGQGIGLAYLVPLALDRLEQNPLADGDFFEGDLLLKVLSADARFWDEHSDLRSCALAIAESTLGITNAARRNNSTFPPLNVINACAAFQRRYAPANRKSTI